MNIKQCNHCKVEKVISDFWKDQTSFDGYRPRCKKCDGLYYKNYRLKNKEKVKGLNRIWREKNEKERRKYRKHYYQNNIEKIKEYLSYYKEIAENKRLIRLYGISQKEWDERLLLQKNQCAICSNIFKNKKEIQTDHNHQTKKFRGLLCSKCNKILGYALDKPRILRLAADYLENTGL